MKLCVKVKTRSQKSLLVKDGSGKYTAFLQAAPVENSANRELIALIADTLNISKSRVSIIKGMNSREKVIDIGE